MARNVRTIEPLEHLMAFTTVVFEGFGVTRGFVTLGFNVAFTLALGVGEAFEVIFGEGLTEALDMYFDKSISPPS